MLTHKQLFEIFDKAKKATSGPWEYEYDLLKDARGNRISTFDSVIAIRYQSADTGDFIASVNPQVIQELVARLTEAERLLQDCGNELFLSLLKHPEDRGGVCEKFSNDVKYYQYKWGLK